MRAVGIQQALGLCCHSQFLHQTLTQPGHNMGLTLLELMRKIGIAGHEKGRQSGFLLVDEN